jgi:hypothetical protein
MPTGETAADRIVGSIVCLRKGREGLAQLPQPRDRFAIKARIDIYEELMNSVGEINRTLKRLSSDARPSCTSGDYSP